MNFVVSFVGGILSSVLIPIAVLAMIVFIGVWTYRDAVSKGLNGVLWTLVVVLVPSCIGLIVYLCVRYDSKKVTCSKCLKPVSSNTKFCSNCGEELVPVVEHTETDENFVKAQKKLLIGFFSSFAITFVAGLVSIALMLVGVVQATDKALNIAKDVTENVSVETLESVDKLLGEQGLRVRVDGDEVFIKDADGNTVVHVSDDGEVVDVDTNAIQKILGSLGVNVNSTLSDEELDKLYEKLLQDMENLEGSEEVNQKLEEIIEKNNDKNSTKNNSTDATEATTAADKQ